MITKVICINNYGQESRLTINKQYNSCHPNDTINHIYIIDNSGEQRYYNITRFITLENYREKQLNLILI